MDSKALEIINHWIKSNEDKELLIKYIENLKENK